MASLPEPFAEARSNFLASLTPQDQALVASTGSSEDLVRDVKRLELQHAQSSRARNFAAMLKPIISGLEQYGKALDVLSNVKPDVLCFLWGAIRISIQAVSSFIEYFEKLVAMLQQLSDNLARLRLYAKLYPGKEALRISLLKMYGYVLEFCLKSRKVFLDAKTHKFFSTGTRTGFKALWKPFKMEFGDLLEQIRYHFDLIEKEANAAEMEESSQFREQGRAEIAAAEAERQRQTERWDSMQTHQQKVDDALDDEQRERVLNWLPGRHITPDTDHAAARKLHHPHSGTWFINSIEYQEWLNRPNSTFWVHAIPGAGKTILLSTIIEGLKRTIHQNDIAFTFFYCRYNDSGKRSWSSLVASTIRQFCSAQTTCSQEYLKYVNSVRKTRPTSPDDVTLLDMLLASSSYFKQLVLVVDALDECEDCIEFIQGLAHVKGTTSADLKLLISSRKEVDIARELSSFLDFERAITKEDLTEDVRSYVAADISDRLKTRKLKLRDPTLESHIVDSLVKGSDGMFQWVKCQLDQLRTLKSDKAIKEALASLPRGLDDTYNRILGRIKRDSKDNLEDVIRLLRWITISAIPLTVGELAQAMVINIGDEQLDFSTIVTDPMDILEYCGAFVVENTTAKDVTYVTLAHFSIKEYFMSERILDSPIPGLYLDNSDIQKWAASTCLKFLCMDDFSCGASYSVDVLCERHTRYPFLYYAAHHWKFHFNQLGDNEDSATLLMETIFKDDKEANSSVWQQVEQNYIGRHGAEEIMRLRYCRSTIHKEQEDEAIISQMSYTDRTPLHIAAALGHTCAIKRLLDGGIDINLQLENLDCGDTPLFAAADANKPLAVRYLLQNGADPELCGGSRHDPYAGPLQIAASNHNPDVVRVLLEHGADVNVRGYNHGPPLLMVNKYPHTDTARLDVANLLLDYKADVELQGPKPADSYDSIGEEDYAPLHMAAEVGDLEMVRLLLARGADIEALGGEYGTPLQAAAAKGHKEVVRYLIQSGADVNGVWGRYKGPLHAACEAEKDPFDIARMLLDSGAEVYVSNSGSRNALCSAASHGYIRTLRLLLDSGPAPSEKFPGEILASSVLALILATLRWPNHKLLQAVGRLGSGKEGNFSHGALERAAATAAQASNYAAVEMLLSAASGEGLSPEALGRLLQSATGATKAMAIVRLLLDRGAEVNVITDDRDPALVNAAAHNNIESVRILLENGADTSAQRRNGDTALLAAAENGYVEVVQLLIDAGADIEGSNIAKGNTPLTEAVRKERSEVVTIFLSTGANINARTKRESKTPLHLAAEQEDELILKLLLEGGANLSEADGSGDTALHIASRTGRLESVKLLLQAGSPVNILNQRNETPLHLAVLGAGRQITEKPSEWSKPILRETWLRIVSLLFEYGASRDTPDNCEPPTLHLSVECFDIFTMESALNRIETPRQKDKFGRTPLHIAAGTGQVDALRLFGAHGFSWNDVDNGGSNIFLTGIKMQQPDFVNFILESEQFDSLVSGTDINGATALHFAILAMSDEGLITQLLEKGIDPQATDCNGRNVLHYVLMSSNCSWKIKEAAAFKCPGGPQTYGDEQEMKMFYIKLFIQHGVDPNKQDEDGQTSLMRAVQEFNEPVIEYLLTHGADPRITDKQGTSVLHCLPMFYSSSCAVADMLLNHGANMRAIDGCGRTVLHSQLETRGGIADTKFIVSRGAKVDVVDNKDRNEFYHVIKGRSIDIETLRFLRDEGANVHIKDDRGATLLHLAVCNQASSSALEFFLQCGLDINAIDMTGSTALHYAVERYEGWGNPNVGTGRYRYKRGWLDLVDRGVEEVQFLLDNGANVSATDTETMTPLHRVLQRTSSWDDRVPKIVSKLVDHGAEPLAMDKQGRNAIELCLLSPDGQEPLLDARKRRSKQQTMQCLLKSCGGFRHLEAALRERVIALLGDYDETSPIFDTELEQS